MKIITIISNIIETIKLVVPNWEFKGGKNNSIATNRINSNDNLNSAR